MVKLFFIIVGLILGSHLHHPILGLLIGWYIGSRFQKAIRMNTMKFSYHSPFQTQFFKTTFSVMGYIAKSDGHISSSEIKAAEHIMKQLRLNSSMRKEAMNAFRFGKSDSFHLDQQLQSIQSLSMFQPELVQLFMDIQWMAARADGQIGPNKQRILDEIARKLGMHQQRRSYHQSSTSSTSSIHFSQACELLGVQSNDSEQVIKKAYRKMIGKYHPDRMVAKGLPEEMMRMANKKSQDIKEAYDVIRKVRGF